jgi:type VI secretion system protein ImpH
MATESRRTLPAVGERLYEHPAAFEFFQAVRLLRRIRGGRGGVGELDPGDEIVRFRSAVSLAFPRADITELHRAGDGEPAARMTVGFMGMATPGSFGALPLCYTRETLEQEDQKNPALRDFFDLFNHRALSLFYRAWEKHCLPVQHESGDAPFFERALFGLAGLGTPGLRDRCAFDDHALLSRGGLLGMSPIPATALRGVLESYFQVPVEIEQFVPTWYEIDEGEQNRLGQRGSRLGEDLFLGGRVRLVQFKFGVRLGPLDWDGYQEFFPVAQGFRALVDMVRLASTPDLDFEVRPVLRAEDVPPLKLEREPKRACRLGWSTWLASEAPARDANDAVLVPQEGPMEARP